MNTVNPNNVILIGYAGHALVVAEALVLSGYNIIGYLEKEKVTNNLFNIEYLGFESDHSVLERIQGYTVFPAIGDNHIREKVSSFFENNGFLLALALHPNSSISKQAVVGHGTLVARGANVNPFVTIGKGVIVNTGAIIEHGCIINDFAHVAPGAVLTGNVSVGKRSLIGANAVIKQGIKVGENVTIGAGAVVLTDIDDNLTVVGNPAKRIK